MLYPSPAYVGVDPTSGRKAFTYAALDDDLRPLALAGGDLDEVLAYVGALEQAWVAVNSPPRPNRGVAKAAGARRALQPLRQAGRGAEMRLCEHLLRERGIPVSPTPASVAACPAWMQQGFVFHRRLEQLGYRPYPAREARVCLETHPQAAFVTMLGGALLSKSTLEGRLQRQLLLVEAGVRLRDPMEFFEEITRHRLLRGQLPYELVYPADQLDALVAAYVAWMAARRPAQVCAVGDPEEGQIVLPVAELKAAYERF